MLSESLFSGLDPAIQLCGFDDGLNKVNGLLNLEILSHYELVEAELSVDAMLWYFEGHLGLDVVRQSLLVDPEVVH